MHSYAYRSAFTEAKTKLFSARLSLIGTHNSFQLQYCNENNATACVWAQLCLEAGEATQIQIFLITRRRARG